VENAPHVFNFIAISQFANHHAPSAGLALSVRLGCIAEEAMPDSRILILCTGNSARSQMAAGFLKSWDSHLDVYSAGTDPAPKINPFAVQAMKEVGVDISSDYPKSVKQFLGQRAHRVLRPGEGNWHRRPEVGRIPRRSRRHSKTFS